MRAKEVVIPSLVGLVLLMIVISVGMWQAEKIGYIKGQVDYARGIIKYHIVTNTVESVELKEKE